MYISRPKVRSQEIIPHKFQVAKFQNARPQPELSLPSEDSPRERTKSTAPVLLSTTKGLRVRAPMLGEW